MHKLWLTLFLLSGMSVNAQTSIHRCPQEDGTITFQEMPCVDPADSVNDDSESDASVPAPTDGHFDFENPFDDIDEAPLPSESVPPPLPSQDRAACEKTTRNAIDAIDFEMRKPYTEEEGQQYLADLLELTQQLRDCKQL